MLGLAADELTLVSGNLLRTCGLFEGKLTAADNGFGLGWQNLGGIEPLQRYNYNFGNPLFLGRQTDGYRDNVSSSLTENITLGKDRKLKQSYF